MKKELRVGLDFAAPIPLHTDFSSAVFEGFEVDLMQLIADRLDVKLVHEVSLWDTILQKLRSGHIDVICSAVTVTNERKQYLDFSVPYLCFRLCVVTRSDDVIGSAEDVSSKIIGVRKATEASALINSRWKENPVIYGDTNEELYQLLTDKKIDLLIDDSPIAGAFVSRMDKLKIAFFLPGTESCYAIATGKGNLIILNQINEVLASIRQNDVWQNLYDKWFGNAQL